jgi:hypothetical protein
MQHTRPLAKGAALTVGAMALVTGPLASGTWAAEKETDRPDRTERAEQAERSERDDETSVVTEDDDTNDGDTPNNVVDEENDHPSGKDRSVEFGGSGNQGAAAHDPDDDGNGPDRSNGGLDQPDGDGGEDLADQDGNNGCGNDDDFEDDNEGLCGKPEAPPAVGKDDDVDEVDDEDEVIEDDEDEVVTDVEDDTDDVEVRSSDLRRTPLAAITSTPATPLALTAEVLSNGLTAPAAAPAAEVQAAAATSAPAGELPFTGSNGPATAIAGALAVAGGWLLTRLGRNRRHTTA